MSKRIQLSDHFDNKRIIRFVIPSIIMMVFTSIYSIVDGFFVSNFAGKTSFAALNLIFPFFMLIGALGFMMGAGGTAVVSRTLGENRKEDASRYFSLIVYFTLFMGVIAAILGFIFMPSVARLLGAKGEMLEKCILYGRILMLSFPAFMLQYVFQTFFVAAEKPRLGLAFIIGAGCLNIVLDAIFVVGFKWGLAGAAAATCIGQVFAGLGPAVYFILPNDSLLKLTKTRFYGKVLLKSLTNGSSELMSNVADSLVNILYNWQLLRFAGEDGVAAYGAIMYICFISLAVFLGYSMGIAPVVGYHFGAGNKSELRNLFIRSMMLTGMMGAAILILAEVFAGNITGIFVGYDEGLRNMTLHGLRIYSISYILMGFNIFASGFFTALSDGVTSAIISFMRALVFESAAVIILPMIFGLDGIWSTIIAAESAALTITIFFMIHKRRVFGY